MFFIKCVLNEITVLIVPKRTIIDHYNTINIIINITINEILHYSMVF